MQYTTLIDADTLLKNINQADWVVVDCRYSLLNTDAGPQAYRLGHLPNARYADLNKHLSSAITPMTGRHPLPDIRELCRKLGEWGISNSTQVVVYDDMGGAFAARLWWLFRWLGHKQVAVLDGGLYDWQKRHYPLTTVLPKVNAVIFRPYPDNNLWLNALAVQNGLASKRLILLDARAPQRYRGEQEPIDPIAGHVPGALNHPQQSNLDANQRFLSPTQLRQQFQTLIGSKSSEQVVHMCGSGVTACHNLLAMEHAGLGGSKLYAGSWSEWIRNKNRPVATG